MGLVVLTTAVNSFDANFGASTLSVLSSLRCLPAQREAKDGRLIHRVTLARYWSSNYRHSSIRSSRLGEGDDVRLLGRCRSELCLYVQICLSHHFP